jgi:predicted  nucleic acid-binding Zn-ribbon protein
MDQKLDIEHRLTAVEGRCKSNSHRLEEVEKRQDNLDRLTTSVSLLAEREERMESDVKEIKADVKTLAEKPGKRWDGLVDKLIWGVAGAVLAFLLARIGL